MEGVQAYGIELKWDDPKEWILENSPWKLNDSEKNSLRSIKAVDVGCETESEKTSIDCVNENKNIDNSKMQASNVGVTDYQNSFAQFINDEADNEDIMDRVLSPVTSPSKSSLSTTKLNDGDNLINMLMRLQEVTMGNQKRVVSTRLISDTNLSLNNNMCLSMPKSVESAL